MKSLLVRMVRMVPKVRLTIGSRNAINTVLL
jgi:hypothetical protein